MAKLIRAGGHVRTFEWELFWEYTIKAGQTLMCNAIYLSHQKPHATLLCLLTLLFKTNGIFHKVWNI